MAQQSNIIVIDRISPAMTQMAQDFPREFGRGLLALGQRWRKKMAEGMQRGAPAGQPFKPLAEMTRRLRAMRGLRVIQLKEINKRATARNRRTLKLEGVQDIKKTRSAAAFADRAKKLKRKDDLLQGFGGKLARLAEFATPGKNSLRVGWLGETFEGADRIAARWQRSEAHPFTREQRHGWHKVFGDALPSETYSRPARNPVAPWDNEFRADIETTVTKTVTALRDAAAAKAAK